MTTEKLHAFYDRDVEAILADPAISVAHEHLLSALEFGTLRSAEPTDKGWQVNAWVKKAILLGFRSTQMQPLEGAWFTFHDKTGFPPRHFDAADGVRIVPGGTAIRRGSFVARSVVVMPPAYINVGSYVDEGTMVDSHALVGSCAQIGKRVHLSAAAQVGGVLEPAGAMPVIVEDDAFVGGLCGLFEGVRVGKRAVLASGVILTGSTPVQDLVNETVHYGLVPEGAVVVPGSRTPSSDYGKAQGIQLSCPVIVKYRDDKTDASTALESALR